jgi:hypothetical protein
MPGQKPIRRKVFVMKKRTTSIYLATCAACGTKQQTERKTKLRKDWFCAECARRKSLKSGMDLNQRGREWTKKTGAKYQAINPDKVAVRDNWHCGLCNGEIVGFYPNKLGMSVDHIVPLAIGGDHVYDNVRAAHWICNINRGVGLICGKPHPGRTRCHPRTCDFSKFWPINNPEFIKDKQLCV